MPVPLAHSLNPSDKWAVSVGAYAKDQPVLRRRKILFGEVSFRNEVSSIHDVVWIERLL